MPKRKQFIFPARRPHRFRNTDVPVPGISGRSSSIPTATICGSGTMPKWSRRGPCRSIATKTAGGTVGHTTSRTQSHHGQSSRLPTLRFSISQVCVITTTRPPRRSGGRETNPLNPMCGCDVRTPRQPLRPHAWKVLGTCSNRLFRRSSGQSRRQGESSCRRGGNC